MVYVTLLLTITVLLYLILYKATESTYSIKQRLLDVRMAEDEEIDELKKPFIERAVYPIYNHLFQFLDRLTPTNIADKYQQTILQAGVSSKVTPIKILINQLLSSILGALLSLLYFQITKNKINIALIFAMSVIAFLIPIVYYRTKAKERQKLIKNSLPDLLDMLYVSVEAGLSFDAAIKKTAAKMKGPLSMEISKAMDDITKGREREEALRSIGQRTQVEDVSTFLTAVIQSELLGSNIANMLRIQSRVMREKRKQRAEEDAAKMPLKMLFPMILFLFPALFLVILGPAIISVMKVLTSV